MKMYEVVVGNVGLVHSGTDKNKAYQEYDAYVLLSSKCQGRAGGEDVTLFEDGEIIAEHEGLRHIK
jgi:hypothetical protein